MPKTQDPYVEEFSRQGDTFKALARLTEQYAETERDRCMVAVALGLSDVCIMLAEAREEELKEDKAVE